MACGCNQNWNQGCNENWNQGCGGCQRPSACEQAIRQIERDAAELYRELEEAQKNVCKLRRDIEALYRQCGRAPQPPSPCPRPCPGPCSRPCPRDCGCDR
ncbi:MAG: hypothetical protein ACRC1P_05930 [Cellulosilyticaceae bacterium]